MSRHPVYALKGAANYCEQRQTEADCCEVQCTVREAIKKDQETRYNDEDLKPSQMEHC